MNACFLFGHADTPLSALPDLVKAIEGAVSEGINVFYVGYHGSFDRMAATALRQCKQKHSDIAAILVLPYHPAEYSVEKPGGFDGTYYPPLENIPRRVALIRANQYMIQSSDRIICYVKHYGNSRNLLAYAQKRGIPITNIG